MPIRTALRSARTRLLAATMTFAAACGPGMSNPAHATAAGPALDPQEHALGKQINAYRAARGRAPLKVSAPLTRAAKWLSRDMASNDYLDHTDSRGRDFDRRIPAFGFKGASLGENIAGGAAEASAIFAILRRSAFHRRNMLRAKLKVIGIGRAYSEGTMLGWYWTMTFGAGRARAAG